MSSINKRADEQIKKIILEKEGVIVVGFVSPTIPLTLECSNGHQFEALIGEVRKGSWCPKCISPLSILEGVLNKLGVTYVKSYTIPGSDSNKFDYLIKLKDCEYLLDVDVNIEGKQQEIKDKISICKKRSLRQIRIDEKFLDDEETLDKFLFKTLTSDGSLFFLNETSYSCLSDPTIECEGLTLHEKEEYITELLRYNRRVVLGYCSSFKDDDGDSIEAQERRIRSHARDRNITVAFIFKDKDLADRPALKELLRLVSKRVTILVTSMDKIANNIVDMLMINIHMSDKNSKVIYMSDTR